MRVCDTSSKDGRMGFGCSEPREWPEAPVSYTVPPSRLALPSAALTSREIESSQMINKSGSHADSRQIPAEDDSHLPPSAPILGSPSDQAAYWHITGSPMSFDNIGFSRPSDKALGSGAPGSDEGRKVKWLICADCDLGPIGWSYEGGTEAWLAVERVRYGARP